MIILRNKSFSSKKDKAKNATKTAAGVGLGIAGSKLIKDSNKEGELTGRITLYHSIGRKHVKEALEKGIEGKHGLTSKDSLTPEDVKTRDGRPLVYAAKTKELADQTSHSRKVSKNPRNSKTLEISIPHEELEKNRVYENPETLNTKSHEEYKKKGGKMTKRSYNKLSANPDSETVIVNGSIKPEHIKGSSKYKKNSIKEVSEYVKRNPKRFGKGTAKLVGGTAIAAGGVKLAKNTEDSKEKDAVIASTAVGAGGIVAKKELDVTKKKVSRVEDRVQSIKNKINTENRNEINKLILTKDSKFHPSKFKGGIKEASTAAMNYVSGNKKSALKKLENSSGKIIKGIEKSGKTKAAVKGASIAVGGYILGKKTLKAKKKE